MERKNTSIRLKEIMTERNLKQVDILRMAEPYAKQYNIKFNKSDLSQYVSGKTEPGQDKLFLLGITLDVSETWLMGYDVPRERNPIASRMTIAANNGNKLAQEYIKMNNEKYYLNDDAREMAQFMFDNPEYKVLFDATRKVKKEDIEFVKDFIERLNK